MIKKVCTNITLTIGVRKERLMIIVSEIHRIIEFIIGNQIK